MARFFCGDSECFLGQCGFCMGGWVAPLIYIEEGHTYFFPECSQLYYRVHICKSTYLPRVCELISQFIVCMCRIEGHDTYSHVLLTLSSRILRTFQMKINLFFHSKQLGMIKIIIKLTFSLYNVQVHVILDNM